MKPDLDPWLSDAAFRVAHRRESRADARALWDAARAVSLSDTAVLGRLVRWRIPGLAPNVSFEQLFSHPPFTVLDAGEENLVSGLVGRIWTLRRDYPRLEAPEDFRSWATPGTARVLFAHWVQETDGGHAALHSEVRVQPFGAQGRFGVAAVRPLVAAFGPLVGSEGIEAAVRRAERG